MEKFFIICIAIYAVAWIALLICMQSEKDLFIISYVLGKVLDIIGIVLLVLGVCSLIGIEFALPIGKKIAIAAIVGVIVGRAAILKVINS